MGRSTRESETQADRKSTEKKQGVIARNTQNRTNNHVADSEGENV